jgi:glycosyltransferase involved in cell wall biosynthesis
MSGEPLISVIVPCFNQGVYLNDALQSLVDQSYHNWECLVIDDGATDDTAIIARQWERKDKRVKYFYKENGGLSSARNRGLAEAGGEYIQFLDADDIIDSNKFTVSLKLGLNAGLVISNYKMFTIRGGPFTEPAWQLNMDQFNFETILNKWDDEIAIPIHCGLFKRELFNDIRFNESLKAKEDWMMWLQVYQLPVATVFIDEPYALYRFVPNGMTQNKPLMNNNLVLAYQLIYEKIPDAYRADLYKKAVNHLGALLEETTHLLVKTRESKSYRAGNFFVRNLKRLFKKSS